MKGFVPTPPETVDAMVELLFRGHRPRPSDSVLDPGCGTGEFIDGVIRWCSRQGLPLPGITGVESDPQHLPVLRAKYEGRRAVRIDHADFLTDRPATYNFIVGNPPYVAITRMSEDEKARCRARYATARGLASRMVLQVHDELVFDVEPDEKEEVLEVARAGMEGAMELRVPLKVDFGFGQNWADCKG